MNQIKRQPTLGCFKASTKPKLNPNVCSTLYFATSSWTRKGWLNIKGKPPNSPTLWSWSGKKVQAGPRKGWDQPLGFFTKFCTPLPCGATFVAPNPEIFTRIG